jgi:cytochrome b subunit of formate dehydrogenase
MVAEKGETETTAQAAAQAAPATTAPAPEARPRSPYVRRFSPYQRVSHFLLMVSFLGLSGTGVPLLFSHERWAWWLSRIWGGYAAAGAIHRFFAVILITVFAVHVAQLMYRIIFKRELTLLWGPTSMVPQPRDVRELWGHVKFFVGLGPRPQFDRYTYWEKFDYWAVFWGMFIIGGSGLLLWFPAFFAKVVPGWLFNIAEVIHGEEALLAIAFIFTVHFFNTHLRPNKFPMDVVIFTGTMPRDEFDDERSLERDRLATAGKLEKLDEPHPSRELVLVARVIGTFGVCFGLAIVALIVYAVLH